MSKPGLWAHLRVSEGGRLTFCVVDEQPPSTKNQTNCSQEFFRKRSFETFFLYKYVFFRLCPGRGFGTLTRRNSPTSTRDPLWKALFVSVVDAKK